MQYYLKIITKISVIVSGLACDQFDDQIGYAEPTINWKFKLCLAAILRHMENNFLENVPEHVTNACFDTMASRGFTGCAGSIDCSHVTWKCPKYLQAVCKGKENDTTIAMQVVVTPDLYCSSIFVGAPGSTNDRSILTMDGFFTISSIVGLRSLEVLEHSRYQVLLLHKITTLPTVYIRLGQFSPSPSRFQSLPMKRHTPNDTQVHGKTSSVFLESSNSSSRLFEQVTGSNSAMSEYFVTS